MARIYLREGDAVVPMDEQPYRAEDVLQRLIAQHPEILSGADGNANWLLVRREAGVADREEGTGRFSLDHLFLDAAGIPTLVEVKRSSDTRTRREVVAQMLDYAANATAFWRVDALRAWFAEECEQRGVTTELAFREAFAVNDEDAYWDGVRRNLAADRIRLVFVSDDIPKELSAIVEFLNRQMSETEVLALEVKQYVEAGGLRQTLVPKIVGQTQAAIAAKGGAARSTAAWDETSFLAELDHRDVAAVQTARSLLDKATSGDETRVEYGRGTATGTASIHFTRGGARLIGCRLWTDGGINIPFNFMDAPFGTDTAMRDELRDKIRSAVPRSNLLREDPSRRKAPGFHLTDFDDETAIKRFWEALQWAFEETYTAHRDLDA